MAARQDDRRQDDRRDDRREDDRRDRTNPQEVSFSQRDRDALQRGFAEMAREVSDMKAALNRDDGYGYIQGSVVNAAEMLKAAFDAFTKGSSNAQFVKYKQGAANDESTSPDRRVAKNEEGREGTLGVHNPHDHGDQNRRDENREREDRQVRDERERRRTAA